MDRFQVERPGVMKKYLPLKELLITTNIPEKLTAPPVLSIILTIATILHFAPRFWVSRDQPKPGYFLKGGRERTLRTRLASRNVLKQEITKTNERGFINSREVLKYEIDREVQRRRNCYTPKRPH